MTLPEGFDEALDARLIELEREARPLQWTTVGGMRVADLAYDLRLKLRTEWKAPKVKGEVAGDDDHQKMIFRAAARINRLDEIAWRCVLVCAACAALAAMALIWLVS